MGWEDPIVGDVRRTRERLSAKFDFDLQAIFADIRARQSGVGDRLVRLKRDRKPQQDDLPERPTRSVSDG